MPVITFYRQERRDGGVRTGIEVAGHAAFQRFDEAHIDSDPALLWYVDVQCAGNGVPKESEKAREYFLQNAAMIKEHLRLLASEIPAGIDPGDLPLQRNFAMRGRVKGMISCSAVQRLAAKEIAVKLFDIAGDWEGMIEKLSEYQPL